MFLQEPRTPTFSSVPYAPLTPCPPRGSPSLASDVLSAFPGALAGHAPVSLRWNPQNPRSPDQERAPSLSQTPRKLLRSAAPDLDLLGLSGTRGRPAQHQRPLQVGPACAPSGPPEPHTRVTTTFKGTALQGTPEVRLEGAVALRGGASAHSSPRTRPSLLFSYASYAMTQVRRAKSSGSIPESKDSAAAWRGSRGVREWRHFRLRA